MPPVDTNHNPFGGWSNRTNHYSPYGGGSGPPPSVFGALPYPTPPSNFPQQNSNISTYYLTSLNPSVLNCAVIDHGPRQRLHYSVSTDNSMPGYTVFKNAERKSVALIEWTRHPRVEVRGAVPKQETKGWLKISRDQTYRTMTVRGFQYTLAPDNQYINLCSFGSTPQFLGRISRGEETVVIELTPDAIQLGLLDTIVVAAVLLQCGHNID
ncbi:hypothetical protein C8F04DRAFT_1040546 [Mycena alexandri]|uniref:DUF6593 domain-containing protein n=1 Tax=Mycena alexandri TaxID=1745969 RepID=A0AAD6S6E6_9AGAR|nr:hypothetical protein C8F04DRAFT_1049612 [Mycena alexandri]KAJ7032438.1 hypothetical protein C8F04DRAFT_1040546 [Mycena alexandri]